ncbi:DNA repair protein RecO [Clavibacter michiganensis]|uniref:DNA repair protein RecO n=1 Tax=Clavibacter michiganensis TaxID=28447 RepID=A0A251YRK5_9MICO|nr:DNA repair protein RecO [Clavibacter michiganensis]OUE26884.1 DNA repair protein RecO [Clavibacter michiganensis]
MPLYRDEIVVLRTHKLGEADRIVTMLSRQHGKIRAVAKGVRRTQSKFGARLEPFMVADAQFFEGRTLDIITQAESIASYGALIATDYGSYTAASAMVETADRVTEDEGSLQQYLLLVGALRSLSRREHGASLTLDSYLLRSLSMAGWAPSFQDCAVTGAPGPHSAFVVQLGGVVADAAAPPGSPRLDPDTLALLSALLTGDWGHAEAATLRSQARASGVVAAYAQWHLDRGIRSLGLVDRSDARQLLPPSEQPVPLDAPDLDGADPDPAAALAAATASVVRATPRDADPEPDDATATHATADRSPAQETTP